MLVLWVSRDVMPKFIGLTLLPLLLLATGCGDRSKPQDRKMTVTKVTDPPAQTVSALTAADQQRLRDQRAVVEKYLTDDESRRKYQTAAGKLGIIRAILQANVFKADETYKLQCLGIVLGDAFVQKMNMEWVMVEDNFGRDPAVRFPETTIILFPLTMISKRLERGETVDVFELFNTAANKVEEVRRRGG